MEHSPGILSVIAPWGIYIRFYTLQTSQYTAPSIYTHLRSNLSFSDTPDQSTKGMDTTCDKQSHSLVGSGIIYLGQCAVLCACHLSTTTSKMVFLYVPQECRQSILPLCREQPRWFCRPTDISHHSGANAHPGGTALGLVNGIHRIRRHGHDLRLFSAAKSRFSRPPTKGIIRPYRSTPPPHA